MWRVAEAAEAEEVAVPDRLKTPAVAEDLSARVPTATGVRIGRHAELIGFRPTVLNGKSTAGVHKLILFINVYLLTALIKIF